MRALDRTMLEDLRGSVEQGAVSLGHDARRAAVIEVPMGDHHVIDGLQPDPGLHQPLGHGGDREAGIQHQQLIPGPEERGVAAATACEDA